MPPSDLFQIANSLALGGWIALALTPLAPQITRGIALGVLAIQALLYPGLIVIYAPGAEGGFDTLANVQLIFDAPGTALAGWVHYLAFDLFVGLWEVRTARRLGMSHWLVLPCLLGTFMVGPVGLVLFVLLVIATRRDPRALLGEPA